MQLLHELATTSTGNREISMPEPEIARLLSQIAPSKALDTLSEDSLPSAVPPSTAWLTGEGRAQQPDPGPSTSEGPKSNGLVTEGLTTQYPPTPRSQTASPLPEAASASAWTKGEPPASATEGTTSGGLPVLDEAAAFARTEMQLEGNAPLLWDPGQPLDFAPEVAPSSTDWWTTSSLTSTAALAVSKPAPPPSSAAAAALLSSSELLGYLEEQGGAEAGSVTFQRAHPESLDFHQMYEQLATWHGKYHSCHVPRWVYRLSMCWLPSPIKLGLQQLAILWIRFFCSIDFERLVLRYKGT